MATRRTRTCASTAALLAAAMGSSMRGKSRAMTATCRTSMRARTLVSLRCGDGHLRADLARARRATKLDPPGDGCTEACQMPACGDGEVSRGEECDDGNLDVGDGCSQCRAEVVKLSLGKRTAAPASLGSVWCWGLNDQGNRAVKGRSYRRLAGHRAHGRSPHLSGSRHSYLVTEQGRLVLGANGYGQLGDGSREASRSPQRDPNLKMLPWSQPASGTPVRCSKTVRRCWGRNQFGQLGNQNLVDQIAPGAVNNLAASINLAPGGHHTCGVGGTGQVACWGAPPPISSVMGAQQGLRSSAGLVVGLAGVAQPRRAAHLRCEHARPGRVLGYGFFGQLGNGSAQNGAAGGGALGG